VSGSTNTAMRSFKFTSESFLRIVAPFLVQGLGVRLMHADRRKGPCEKLAARVVAVALAVVFPLLPGRHGWQALPIAAAVPAGEGGRPAHYSHTADYAGFDGGVPSDQREPAHSQHALSITTAGRSPVPRPSLCPLSPAQSAPVYAVRTCWASLCNVNLRVELRRVWTFWQAR
jgi:hypothetical protein